MEITLVKDNRGEEAELCRKNLRALSESVSDDRLESCRTDCPSEEVPIGQKVPGSVSHRAEVVGQDLLKRSSISLAHKIILRQILKMLTGGCQLTELWATEEHLFS